MSKENKEAEDNLSEIKELKDQINQLTNEKDKYLDIAQRAQADLVNYRKKSSIDLQESEERSQRRILHQIIMILDQINMALSAKVNTNFRVITDLSDLKLRGYDRIFDPFFYISSAKHFKKKTQPKTSNINVLLNRIELNKKKLIFIYISVRNLFIKYLVL